MRNFVAIWRREMKTYLFSFSAYVTMTVVLAVTGLGFWLYAKASHDSVLRLDEMLFWLPTLWLMVLIVATVGTMRLFAEEKRSGTIESLLTAPVTEVEVVLGKYAAALTLFALSFAPTVVYVFVLRRLSSGIGEIDAGPMFGGYLILLLVGAFYVSIGVLISSLTGSQAAAAVGTFGLLCVLFILIGALGYQSGIHSPFVYFSAFEHLKDFSRGVLDTRTIVLYASGTAWMLFATVKVLESRRWM